MAINCLKTQDVNLCEQETIVFEFDDGFKYDMLEQSILKHPLVQKYGVGFYVREILLNLFPLPESKNISDAHNPKNFDNVYPKV